MFEIYKNKKIYITGATGFKGSWLSAWLLRLGAIVKGYSLTELPHYKNLKLDMQNDYGDIRNFYLLQESIKEFAPDMVIHMAAQPLVKSSYLDSNYTFQTNIQGTVNLFESCRNLNNLAGIINVTTDKVFKDKNFQCSYSEIDELGGYDPYSSSKVCSEIITHSYRECFFKDAVIATTRAGNVIGGGDFSKDRLIPDIIKAKQNRETLQIRYPQSIRPFQFILDCLRGYLLLGEQILLNNKLVGTAWNFGSDDITTVEEIVKRSGINYTIKKSEFHETDVLLLNSNKSKIELKWKPKYDINQTLEKTFEWYDEYFTNNKIITVDQIDEYEKI